MNSRCTHLICSFRQMISVKMGAGNYEALLVHNACNQYFPIALATCYSSLFSVTEKIPSKSTKIVNTAELSWQFSKI